MALTKAADRFLCLVYAVYLKRVKEGMSRSDAANFWADESWKRELFPGLPDSDYRDIVRELDAAFDLYMENRFKNNLKEVLDYVSSAFSVVGGLTAFFV